jgi:hypothetical protein
MDPLAIPETLHVGSTGKTIARGAVAGMPQTERERLWYVDADGHTRWPFYDDTGVFGLGDAASIKPFMSRKKLTDLGWSDDKLESERLRIFGKAPKGALTVSDAQVDGIPLMERRKEVFDSVMRALTKP